MEGKKLTREQKKVVYRKAILEAAKQEFIRKGYKDASIAAIMEAAGLGVGTFYNYFSSKEEILMQLLANLLREVTDKLAQMKDAGEAASQRLTEGCHLMAQLLDENQYVLALFLSVGGHGGKGGHPMAAGKMTGKPPMAKPEGTAGAPSRAPQVKDLFLRIIEEGQTEGSIRSDVSAPIIAEMLHSTFQSAAFSRADVPFRENFEQKFRLLLEGMKAR